MSGGSYNYAYNRIEDLAYSIHKTTPLRKAFCSHLLKIAAACHDIEWVDSGDSSPGNEDEAIRACLGQSSDALELAEILADAINARDQLSELIAKQTP